MLALYYAADFGSGSRADKDGKGARSGVENRCHVSWAHKTDFKGKDPQPAKLEAKNAVRLAVLGKDGETGTMSGNKSFLPW
jgi:hypothetical protein